jgi:hypothetical protein
MVLNKTTQQALMTERRFIARTVTEHLIHHLWIFLCRGVRLSGHTRERFGIEYRPCLTSLDSEGLSLFALFTRTGEGHATRYDGQNDTRQYYHPEPEKWVFC